ncbi:MAG TPA: hypothetical protein VFW96_08075 [Thermomicrobiales bacterium]|nr:hypothetical protein [Thermomicrobiales bacterium]
MSGKQQRDILRIFHLVGAALIGVALYAPAAHLGVLLLIVRVVVIPLMVLTGLWMWQQARVRRLFRRGDARPAAAAAQRPAQAPAPRGEARPAPAAPATPPAAPDPLVGAWVCDPARAVYESGQPPRSASYQIAPDGAGLRFTVQWVTAAGQPGGAVYQSVPDGRDYPTDPPGSAETVAHTRVDAGRLDTVAKRQGDVVAWESRVLAADGATMTITQAGIDDQGRPYRNTAVYVKQ